MPSAMGSACTAHKVVPTLLAPIPASAILATTSQLTDTLASVGWALTLLLAWLSVSNCLYVLVDNNECAIDNGGCDHKCTNYGGYFECSCQDGYNLHEDGKTCVDENGREMSPSHTFD